MTSQLTRLFVCAAVLLFGRVSSAEQGGSGSAKTSAPRILMVVTSADKLGSGKPTGLWLEEFAVPYLEFTKAGFTVDVASIKGGSAPIDPRSASEGKWPEAILRLKDTTPIDKISGTSLYDAIVIPGGHGAMVDMPDNKALQHLIVSHDRERKIVAAICHGPAAFGAIRDENGIPFVHDRKLTAFTDDEEAAVQLTGDVPFLLQSQMNSLGANFSAAENFKPNVVRDDTLITGQNPASSAAFAREVVAAVRGTLR